MSSQKANDLHAVMVIWHGISPQIELDYLDWHTYEHMLERVAIPGFIRGRRGHSPESAKQPYLSVYESDEVSVFGSTEYLARLNDPTPWSQRVHPHITNFVRGACQVVASRGIGVGRATLTVRMNHGASPAAQFTATAEELCDTLAQQPFVTAVRYCIGRQDVSGAKTKETELRGTQGGQFDAVVLIDSYDSTHLRREAERIVGLLTAQGFDITPDDYAVYDLAYVVDAREPRGAEAIARRPENAGAE